MTISWSYRESSQPKRAPWPTEGVRGGEDERENLPCGMCFIGEIGRRQGNRMRQCGERGLHRLLSPQGLGGEFHHDN